MVMEKLGLNWPKKLAILEERGVSFSQFCAIVLYGRTLMSLRLKSG